MRIRDTEHEQAELISVCVMETSIDLTLADGQLRVGAFPGMLSDVDLCSRLLLSVVVLILGRDKSSHNFCKVGMGQN